MIDENKLHTPDDDYKKDFPNYNFKGNFKLLLTSGKLLISDPDYIDDVYNNINETSNYLRENVSF
jgi:hypothetical protein